MSRELWLLRHAKAEINGNIDDFDRALKKRGKKAAESMAEWMKNQHLKPDFVISSPAIRAIATARLVCPVLGIAEQDIHQNRQLYMASPETLKNILAQCPEQANRVLVVGHNPGLEDLLLELAISVPRMEKIMPTAALARLKLPNSWQELGVDCAELIDITHAKALEAGEG
jgi:phosphohistidine phosphatase